MLLPTSSEFLALCQAQLWLLTQNLGASMGAIYLTEEMITGQDVQSLSTRFVPIATIPHNLATDTGSNLSVRSIASIAATGTTPSVNHRLALPESPLEAQGAFLSELAPEPVSELVPELVPELSAAPDRSPELVPERLVLPLIHEEMVLGVLVTERSDRRWNVQERQQIDQLVQTVSLACVLDQRSQWLNQQQQQQTQLQLQQHDLMDNLIHQFRNPLTALRTFGKLLLRRLPEGDNNREVASSIVRESDRLQELLLQIDRAIDLDAADLNQPLANVASPPRRPITGAGPQAGTLPGSSGPLPGTLGDRLELQPCDLREILPPLLISAVAVAQEKNLEVHTELPTGIPPVRAQGSALREVLSNLIDNAVKYTPPGGAVHIRVQVDHDRVLVRVTDNGNGIPTEDCDRLFQRHFRGVQAQTDIPGTGLGLAIARDLAQQMGGDIQVFSPMQAAGWIADGSPLPTRRGVTFLLTLMVMA
jgi:signal transduction histidine kinase